MSILSSALPGPSQAPLETFPDVEAVLASVAEDEPIHCLRPQRIEATARAFLAEFPGTVAYATKCNPHHIVLDALFRAGLRDYDVASRREVALVASIPESRGWFMHPVKSRAAITAAWDAGVRDFAVDCIDELNKIHFLLGYPTDLGIHVRLAVSSKDASFDLSSKFGASPSEAVALLRAARRADRVGACFHVGSQCLAPDSWRRAIELVGDVQQRSGVQLQLLDVGGGFPARYPGMEPPPRGDIFGAVVETARRTGLGDVPLMCEPGRAMVADSGSVLVRVELRRDDRLYLNDGTYGSLFDAGVMRWRYPVRLASRPAATQSRRPYRFYGPTCDCLDAMEGPFWLPDDIREGDWIEIGQTGAYGSAMTTSFNGFSSGVTVRVGE